MGRLAEVEKREALADSAELEGGQEDGQGGRLWRGGAGGEIRCTAFSRKARNQTRSWKPELIKNRMGGTGAGTRTSGTRNRSGTEPAEPAEPIRRLAGDGVPDCIMKVSLS